MDIIYRFAIHNNMADIGYLRLILFSTWNENSLVGVSYSEIREALDRCGKD